MIRKLSRYLMLLVIISGAISCSSTGSGTVKESVIFFEEDGEQGGGSFLLIPRELNNALKKGDVDKATALIRAMKTLDIVDETGSSPLHIAVLNKQYAMTERLLQLKFDPNQEETSGFTPLHWAAYMGSKDLIDLLISSGASVNSHNCRGITPLHLAMNFDHSQAAEALIYHGADLLSRQDDGLRPIDLPSETAQKYQRTLTSLKGEIREDSALLKMRFHDDKLLEYYEQFGPTVAQAYYQKGLEAFITGEPALPPTVDSTIVIPGTFHYTETPYFDITINSIGKGPVFGLRADVTVQSAHLGQYLRKKYPVYFGMMEPGEKITRRVVLDIPGFSGIGENLDIDIHYLENHDNVPRDEQGQITINDVDNRSVLQYPDLFSREDLRKLVKAEKVNRTAVDRLIHFGLKDFAINDIIFFCSKKAISQDILERILTDELIPYSNSDLIAIAEEGYLDKTIAEAFFLSGRTFTPEEMQTMMNLNVFSKPRIGYAYIIEDDDTDRSTGNGDGKIQIQESVEFVLLLKNDSVFQLDDIHVEISSKAGTQIALYDEETVLRRFSPSEQLSLSPIIQVKTRFQGDSFPINVRVYNKQFNELLNEDIVIPVGQYVENRIITMSKKVVSNRALNVYNGADENTPVVASLEEGVVFETVGQLDDFYKVKIFERFGWVKLNALDDYQEGHSEFTLVSNIDESQRVFEKVKPEVVIITPSNNDEIDHNRVELTLAALDSARGIEWISVSINGDPLPGSGERGLRILGSAGRVEKTYEIPLRKGNNEIRVVAWNKANVPSEEQVINIFSTGIRNPPRLFVLSVGVSEYQNSEYNLSYAAADAEYIANVFSGQEGKLYESVETVLLTNEKATRTNVMKQMQEFVYQSRPQDVVMIFLAGHGVTRERYYFLPHDADFSQPGVNGIADDELKHELMYNIDAKKSLVMLDTCQSGFLKGRRGTGPDMDAVIEKLAEQEGVVFISASKSTEAALEDDRWGHGAFTKAVQEALDEGLAEDKNHNGAIDINELLDYVTARVLDLTKGQQKPNMSGTGIEFFPIFSLE